MCKGGLEDRENSTSIHEIHSSKSPRPVPCLGAFLLRSCRGCFGRTGLDKAAVPEKYQPRSINERGLQVFLWYLYSRRYE